MRALGFGALFFGIVLSHVSMARDGRPSWSRNDSGVVVFGMPESDQIYLTLSCRVQNEISVDIVMRPDGLRDHQQTTAVFEAAGRTLRRIATAPISDGLDGDNVIVVTSPSDELFDLMIGPKQLAVSVGQTKQLFPLKGAAELIKSLRRDCSASQARP